MTRLSHIAAAHRRCDVQAETSFNCCLLQEHSAVLLDLSQATLTLWSRTTIYFFSPSSRSMSASLPTMPM